MAYVRDARRDALRAVLEHGGLAEALGSVEGEVHIRGEVRGGDLGSDHEHPSSTRDATSSDVASLNIRDELLRDAQLIPEKIHEAINSLELDITNVVKEYCAVANTPSAIVSLSLLRKTLCSKYHVDYVPLRVMVTYLGAGTEILSENSSLAISMTSDRIGRQAGDIVLGTKASAWVPASDRHEIASDPHNKTTLSIQHSNGSRLGARWRRQ